MQPVTKEGGRNFKANNAASPDDDSEIINQAEQNAFYD